MNKKNVGDWGIKAGAVSLAVLVWFHAVTEQVYQREIDIQLQVEDPVSQQLMVANPMPRRVRVLVVGRGKELLRIRQDDFLLRVQQLEGSAGIRFATRLLPSQVEAKATGVEVKVTEVIAPKEIEIILDKRGEREVAVEPLVRLELAESYTQVGGIRVEPSRVRVFGPSRQLVKLKSIQTDSLIMKGVREDVAAQVALRPPQDISLELSDSLVAVKADIQELAEYVIPNVPVRLRHASGRDVDLEPHRVQVVVRGGAEVIGSLDPEQDLKLYVDYADGPKNRGEGVRVKATGDTLFEIREIIPPKVRLIER